MQEHHEHEHHVGAEAVKLAMGEIHHPHDAEDQGQADAEERVDAAEHERVQAMLEEFSHGRRHLRTVTRWTAVRGLRPQALREVSRKAVARPKTASSLDGRAPLSLGGGRYCLTTLPPSIFTR